MQRNTKPVSILTTEPREGWKRFTRGLVAFVAGLLLVLFTSPDQREVLYFGIAILGSGFAYAMTGYIPMLLHRLSSAKRASQRFTDSHPYTSSDDTKR
jgi:hypothetical protein